MRATRSAKVQAAIDHESGNVTNAVVELTSSMDAPAGSLAHTLGALAVVQAHQADAGQPTAATALRLTLTAIDEAARLTERSAGEEWFTPFDIWCGLTEHGFRRKSEVGRALMAFMEAHNMSLDKLGPFDRPWACPKCGFQADRDR